MKKFFSILIVTAALFTQGLTSCSKSNSELIDEYKSAIKEQIEAEGNENPEAVRKASEKASKIAAELKTRTLTPEEQQQVADAASEVAETIVNTGVKMMNNAINQASDEMNDNLSDPQEMDFNIEE